MYVGFQIADKEVKQHRSLCGVWSEDHTYFLRLDNRRISMKSAKFLAIFVVLAVLFAVPAFAQDTGVLDTVRWVPESTTWTIDAAGDSLFSIEVFGWTDQSITALSLGFKIPTSSGGGTGHDDSLIVVDSFNFTMSTGFPVPWAWSAVDSARFADDFLRHSLYNGILLGRIMPTFPANTSSKIGDLFINIPDPTLLPCEFDIAIDSVFFPPAGAFKFSPSGGSGYAPEYVGATIHVVNNICIPDEEPTIYLNPTSFTFNAVENGSNPVAQSLSIINTGSGTLNWTASVDQTWLTLAAYSGTGDGAVNVLANRGSLTAGTYNGTVTVSDPAATNNPQTASVTFIIAPAPPEIVLDTTSFTFDAIEGGPNPDDDTLWISNGGGGTLDWSVGDDATWLTTTPVAGTGDGYTVLSVNVSGQQVGTHVATVFVTDPAASNTPQTVDVTLNIVCDPSEIEVTPLSFTFDAVEGGPNPPAQNMLIGSSGSCDVNWTATIIAGWLSLSEYSGTAASSVDISVDILGLDAGTYEDTIVISHDGINESPVKVPVTLYVNCIPAELETSPSSFAFDAQEDGANPTPQILHITNGGTCELYWGASNSQPWLTLSDYSGTGPIDIDVMVDITSMTAGEYHDTIVVFDDGSQIDTIPVVLTIGTEPLLMVAPSELNFTAPDGGPNPASQDVDITSTDSPDTELEWVVIEPGKPIAWLSYDPALGTTPSVMTVSVNMDGLSAGVYNDSIMLTKNVPDKDDIGDTVTVYAELTVTGVPEIDLIPNYFFFTWEEGSPIVPDDQDMNITNTGSGTLNWTLYDTELIGWLDPSAFSGTAPSVVTLSIDTGPSLTAGNIYVDTIVVECADAINPLEIAIVELEVTEPPVLDDDTVWVGNTSGLPGEQVIVPVTFANSVYLSGISLPLIFDDMLAKIDNGITCDSVSFIGSRVDYIGAKPVTIDNINKTVLAGVIVISEPLIPAGNGLMANLYFSIAPGAAPGIVPIDSTFILPANELMFADSLGGAIYPEFFYGTIEILEPPSTACLEVSDGFFDFQAIVSGPNPYDQYLDIINCGDVELNWDAWTHVGTWLSIDPTTGVDDATVTLSVDITGLPEGDYIDSITVDAGDADNSPQYVHVDLHVGPPLSQYISGVVQDPADVVIDGATVELWDVFPTGTILETATSAGDGSFMFTGYTGDYVVRAYKNGYYQNFMDVTAPDEAVVIVLTPTGTPTPTNEWVDLYCDMAMFEDYPILPGDVVEAYDPDGILCGQYFVTEIGKYGFMPVYRDDDFTPGIDEGCDPGDAITVMLNGFDMTPYLGAPLFWTQNGDRIEACFDGYIIDEICMDLCEGWNLISWNVDTEVDDIDVVMLPIMDYIDVMLGFEQGALTFDPDYPEFSTLEFVDHYHGYWVKMTQAAEFCVSGLPVDPSTPISLEEGWNLASYLPDGVMATEEALVSILDVLIVALGFNCEEGGMVYDPENPGMSDLEFLGPGFGYWYKVTQDVMLTYPSDVPWAAMFSGEPDKTSAKLAVLKDVTPTTQWVDIFGGNVTIDGRALATGSIVEAVDEHGAVCGAFEIKASGRLGFMAVYGDDMTTSDTYEGPTTGGTFYLVVDGIATEETFVWTGHGERVEIGALSSLGGGGVTLPDAYVLEQNYPNPFNPKTSISFSVGNDAYVNLVVYNLLGEVVNVLVDEFRAAGDYTVDWNGNDLSGRTVSSGVYFYKLTSGDYTETRKMMLMK